MDGLWYVEGVAARGDEMSPRAWVGEADGSAIDPTWPSGDLYIGVPFSAATAAARFQQTGTAVLYGRDGHPAVGFIRRLGRLIDHRTAAASAPQP